MTDQHPITPPPELRRLWAQQAQRMAPHDPVAWLEHVANQAARWGADQELKACIEVILSYPGFESPELFVEVLREARRPKPPSLAEQALEALEQIDGWAVSNMNHLSIHDDLVTGVEAIRTALERLKELEKGNG